MHNPIGTRPRRTVACAGLLFALVLAGCSAGSDDSAELTTADGTGTDTDGSGASGDTSTGVAPTPTTTIAVSTTSPPTTSPPTTIAPATTAPRPPTTIRPAPATTAAPPPTAPPTTAAPAPAPGPAPSSSGQCHASYQGTCIPPDVSDADCAGGSGDGPWYVQEKNVSVVGPDVFDLDRDGNGVGCQT